MERKIAVVGLGYVGLPLALSFARMFSGVVGFDISAEKVALLKRGEDPTKEGWEGQIKTSSLKYTADADDLRGADFFVVGVPTPIDEFKMPDLSPVYLACDILGPVLSKGAIVVFESTVYPGVTEDLCGPRLAERSGLKAGVDFKLAYSPERINPGDKEHALERVVKVVSGQDAETLEVVADVYSAVVTAGVYRASSIKVAEAAKVIENTQRDLNIALMNELALIFDRMHISTKEVLEAAGTKWNFLRFQPGLVGGHCIGVDPYYLTTKAQQLGYHPQVILAGRRINDDMGKFVAQKAIKLMIDQGIQIKGAKVGVLGLTFKENVADVRNSRVPELIQELADFGVSCLGHDPLAEAAAVHEEMGLELQKLEDLKDLDCLIIAVGHKAYRELSLKSLDARLKSPAVVVDVKGIINSPAFRPGISYWSL